MKILDQAPVSRKYSKSLFGQNIDRLLLAGSHATERSASEILVSYLDKMLDDRYLLLKNVRLRAQTTVIPMILVGPTGIDVIFPSDASGVFRASGGSWEQLSKKGEKYKPVKPNPLAVVSEMVKMVQVQLEDYQIGDLYIDSWIFFSNPGLHLDATRPYAKIIMPDTLERFVAGLLKTDSVLERQTIYKIIRALENPVIQASPPIQEVSDEFSFLNPKGNSLPRRSILSNLPREEPYLIRKVPFSQRQWSMLVVLVFINIIFLTTLVVVYMIGG